MQSVFGELKHERIPGESLELMDHSPDLSEEFSWAKPNEIIAKVRLRTTYTFLCALISYFEHRNVEVLGKVDRYLRSMHNFSVKATTDTIFPYLYKIGLCTKPQTIYFIACFAPAGIRLLGLGNRQVGRNLHSSQCYQICW